MRTIRFVVLALILVAAGCAGETSRAPEAGSAEAEAPDFSVETFDDGPFALAEQKGRVVVLNFFESW
jgi:cytochrome oxidase Cu insertion factor (SCO1/SenC/PrrC family)